MSDAIVRANLKGLMGNIKRSKYALAPLHEALANSFEAILQKGSFAKEEKPEITITFAYKGMMQEAKELDRIIVQDNGLGFDEKNFSRFETLLDDTKGYNNRGSGRIQFVHRFDRVDVLSYYINDKGEPHKRSFSCTKERFIFSRHNDPDTGNHRTGSTVTFIAGDNLGQDKPYFDTLQINDIVRDLKRQVMLRYYLETQSKEPKAPIINVVFTFNDKETDRTIIKPIDMPTPTETGKVKVRYHKLRNTKKASDIIWEPVNEKEEELKWAHFKISENDLDSNGVWLCSKGVTVSPITYEAINKHGTVNGNRYLTVFYGDVLDKPENVSDSVDSFKFPSQKETEARIREGDMFASKEEFLFFDDIKKEINSAIPGIYNDIINIQKYRDTQVEQIARDHGISIDIARRTKIKLSDSANTITEKLYKEQATYLSKESIRIREVFTELETLNPTSETYQEELQAYSSELLSLIPQQNKEELGRYIIRRDMVAEVLRKILAQELGVQNAPAKQGEKKSPEGLIHDLIFKRKFKDTDQPNDLWILNEEYVHFAGCSDLPISEIKDDQGQSLLKPISKETITEIGLRVDLRPDIFLYPDEGKCVLVELKAPNVDLAVHLNQMTKYCNLIANFSVRKIDQFYCYLIGEKINPRTDLDSTYRLTVSGDWIGTTTSIITMDDRRDPIGSFQIEVIKLSSIYARAHRRNKSFADKLGLRELLRPELNMEKKS